METLTGDQIPVDLGLGVTLVAPGLRGTAERQPGMLGGRANEPENATEALREALSRNEFRQQHAVVVTASETPPPPLDVRAPNGEPGMTLRVPDAGPGRRQVLMLVDEQGVVSWHFPHRVETLPGTVSFTVSRRVARRPADEIEHTNTPATRGLIAAIGTKLLSVFALPLAEKLVGLGARKVAEFYESQTHPYGLRRFTPAGYNTPGADPMDGAAWDDFGHGDEAALLFVHGTASSSHGAFSGLTPEAMGGLIGAYGGRALAFDHHTLSDDLDDNVRELLALIPPGRRLTVDVVTHSRGGLVARALAGAMTGADAPLRVRRVVYVATPNDGTALADPDRIRDYLDRMSTMLNLLPDGPWSAVTDATSGLLTIVRVLAAGAVGALPGLATMNPTGPVLAGLGWASAPGSRQYAVDANFEPTGRLVQLVRGVDGVVDQVFQSAANDIVVPTAGVSSLAAHPDFRIDPADHLALGTTSSVWHCSFFGRPQVGAALAEWLGPEAP